jgi:hypothetical protein
MSDEPERIGVDIKEVSAFAASSQSVPINALSVGDILEVQTTSGSTYRFRVVNPAQSLVDDISDHPICRLPNERLYLSGSLLGDSNVVAQRVLVGYWLEVRNASRRKTLSSGQSVPYVKSTSPVRTVSVNGTQILPLPPTGFQS